MNHVLKIAFSLGLLFGLVAAARADSSGALSMFVIQSTVTDINKTDGELSSHVGDENVYRYRRSGMVFGAEGAFYTLELKVPSSYRNIHIRSFSLDALKILRQAIELGVVYSIIDYRSSPVPRFYESIDIPLRELSIVLSADSSHLNLADLDDANSYSAALLQNLIKSKTGSNL